MKKIILASALLLTAGYTLAQKAISNQELKDRVQLRALVDRYAVESDKGNQEAYREIFVKNLNLKVYAGDNVTEFHNVDDMIRVYKESGKAKVSFHQTGQQYLEFQDSSHASGIVYLTALLVNDKDEPTHLYLRYDDKYQKINGRWWITDRDQHILYVNH